MQLRKITAEKGGHLSRKCPEKGVAYDSVPRASRCLAQGCQEAPLFAWDSIVGETV